MSEKITLNDLYKIIEDKLDSKNRVVIAIDGSICGGKSTLANLLQEKYQATIIRMDDFYKPRNKNIALDVDNLNEGNINYQRFESQILNNLDKEFLSYIRFNCSLQKEENEEIIKLNKLIIVEGTYSLNPRFNRYFDASVFVSIDDELQDERLKKRNQKMFDSFKNIWVKLERNYFNSFNIKARATYVLDGEFNLN